MICPVAGPRVCEAVAATRAWYENPTEGRSPANLLLIAVCEHWCNQCQAHVLDFMTSDPAWVISWLDPYDVRDLILSECRGDVR